MSHFANHPLEHLAKLAKKPLSGRELGPYALRSHQTKFHDDEVLVQDKKCSESNSLPQRLKV